jgi:hypothetical protein
MNYADGSSGNQCTLLSKIATILSYPKLTSDTYMIGGDISGLQRNLKMYSDDTIIRFKTAGSRDSAFSIASGCGLDDLGV